MNLPVARKAARDVRGVAIGMGIAVIALGIITVLTYPSFKDSLADVDTEGAFAGIVGETGSFSTPEGFAYSQFFAFAPVLLIIMGLISGSWAFAGEQGQGTMDLLLSQPITRRRLAVEKALALTVAVVVVGLLALPGLLVAKPFVDEFTIPARRLAGATLMLLPVSLLFLWMALWLSAVAPTRAAAATIATAITVLTYFLHFIGATAESLHWMQKLSPFYWSDSSPALVGDSTWVEGVAVTLVGLVFLAMAVWAFERRDIASGGREWKLLDAKSITGLFNWLPGRAREQAESS